MDEEIKEYQEQREKLIERMKKATRAEIFTNAIRLDMAERGALVPHELSETELVGILVRNLRLSRRLSEAELAKRSGVSLETVSRVENGRHSPRETTVEKLARALDVRSTLLDPDHVFRRWPAIYQPFLSEHEVAEGERESVEQREKASA